MRRTTVSQEKFPLQMFLTTTNRNGDMIARFEDNTNFVLTISGLPKKCVTFASPGDNSHLDSPELLRLISPSIFDVSSPTGRLTGRSARTTKKASAWRSERRSQPPHIPLDTKPAEFSRSKISPGEYSRRE